MMHRTVVCVLLVLVVGTSACWLANDGPQQTPIAPIVDASPSPTPTLEPTAALAPTTTSSPTPASVATSTAAYWRTVERNGEIEGYGYAPHDVRLQAEGSDLIARVKHLSVEPSFRMYSGADLERRYSPYVHFSFGIMETLSGNPPGDGVVVVEYSVASRKPTKAQAIEGAKKWIASERDAWWNKRDAIIFLDDLRFVNWREISEIATGANYRFADHFSCNDNISRSSQCPTWHIGANDYYGSWVWLPLVGQDAALDLPDNERMFRVVAVPYGANTYEHQTALASLANIKAVLEPFLEAHWSKTSVRAEYVDRHRLLWQTKGSDSYSYVSSVGDEGGRISFAQRIVVRNGEAVEAFYTQDYEEGGVVYPAGTRIEPRNIPQTIDLPTLAPRSSLMRHLVEAWISGDRHITDVSFDYEFGYPTAIRWRLKNEPDKFLYASEYTPLDN